MLNFSILLLFSFSLFGQITRSPGASPAGSAGCVQLYVTSTMLGGCVGTVALLGTVDPGFGQVRLGYTDVTVTAQYLEVSDFAVTPTVDATQVKYGAYKTLDLNGTHNFPGGYAGFYSVEVNTTGSLGAAGAPITGLQGNVDINFAVSSAYSAGLFGATQIYAGSAPIVAGVWSWIGMYGGTSPLVTAYYAQAPSTGGTFSGNNVAYFNENMTGFAGTGKDFSWYSEGGTLHAETGSAVTVGLEIERFSMQTADLLDLVDSDGTTKLSFFDKDGILRAAGYKSSDGSTGATVTTCTGFKNGLCISGT